MNASHLVQRFPSSRIFARAALLVGLIALPLTGCGNSLQAVYEADIRFEHCMALDLQPEVRPQIRHQCWKEWVSFYTFGQTRDRVLHAQLRIQQLAGGTRLPSDVRGKALQGPGPTSALAPPPMYEEPSTAESVVESPCLRECQAAHDACQLDCSDSLCERSCAAGHHGCARSCS
ncbi:MAG: hypothetical protein R3B72_33895 [Polyangiaceae bacterium]